MERQRTSKLQRMNLIDLPEPIVKPPAEQIADLMVHKLNATLRVRVNDHKVFFRALWKQQPTTPDAILDAMGPHAPVLLAAAIENLEHITRMAAAVGKTLHDFIAPEDYQPPRAFIIGQDGITLAPPAEGFDAWGNPIPEPEPEPEPEP